MKPHRIYVDRTCVTCGQLFKTRKDGNVKNCSKECLSMYLKVKANLIRNCINCGKEFIAKKQATKYCSRKCSAEHMNKNNSQILKCDCCGAEFKRHNSKIRTPYNFCSSDCSNYYMATHDLLSKENHPNWVGGTAMQRGYKYKRVGKSKYKAKHRLIMEEMIGRELSSNEIVHHIDSNKLNNSPDNLTIVSRAEHINIHRDELQKGRKDVPMTNVNMIEEIER